MRYVHYLNKILDKEAFDHAGLIYGMGHAVYTLSQILEQLFLRDLQNSFQKRRAMQKEFALYEHC